LVTLHKTATFMAICQYLPYSIFGTLFHNKESSGAIIAENSHVDTEI